MAGSVEMSTTPEGRGGGGLDELVRALARYSTALERVSGASAGGRTGGPAAGARPTAIRPAAPPPPVFTALGDYLRRQVPIGTRLFNFLNRRPAGTPPPEAAPTIRQGPEAVTPARARQAMPGPDSTTPDALTGLMRRLVEIAEGIARKMGVSTATPAPPTPPPAPSPAPTPQVSQTPEQMAAEAFPARSPTPTPAPAATASGGGFAGAATAGLAAAVAAPVMFAEALQSVAGKIGTFVQAVNPGLMMQFNMVTRDITATIGTALQPIMQAIVPVMRKMVSALYPLAQAVGEAFGRIMDALQPAFDEFTNMFYVVAAALDPVISLVADALSALAPVVAVVAAWFKSLNTIIGAVLAAFSGMLKGVFGGAGVGDAIKSVADQLMEAFRFMTGAFIRGLAVLLKFFGATAAVTALMQYAKKLAQPREEKAGIAAAQSAQFKQISDLGKDVALQSVIATAVPGGKAPPKNDQDFFADMVGELEAIDKNGFDVIAALNALPDKIAVAIEKAFNKATGQKQGRTWAGFAYDINPLKGAGEALGDMASKMIWGGK